MIANLLVRGREVWYLPVCESKEQIRRGDFLGVHDLIDAIQAYIHNYNQQAGPFIWTEVPSYFRITALEGARSVAQTADRAIQNRAG